MVSKFAKAMANSRSRIEYVVNVDCLCVSMLCSASIGHTSWQLFEAEPLLRDVFASCEEQLGEKHPRSRANPDHKSLVEIRWFCPLYIINHFLKKAMIFCAWKITKMWIITFSCCLNLIFWCPHDAMKPCLHHPTTLPLCAFCRSLHAMHLLAKAVMKTSASEAEILESMQSETKKKMRNFVSNILFFKIIQNQNLSKSLSKLGILMCLCSIGLFVSPSCFFLSHWAIQAKKIFRKGARDARKLGLTKQALAFMQDLGHLAELRLWWHDVTKIHVVTWWSVEENYLFSNFPLWSLWHAATKILQCPLQSSSNPDLRPSVAGPGWIVGSGGTLQTSATRWEMDLWVV